MVLTLWPVPRVGKRVKICTCTHLQSDGCNSESSPLLRSKPDRLWDVDLHVRRNGDAHPKTAGVATTARVVVSGSKVAGQKLISQKVGGFVPWYLRHGQAPLVWI